MLYKDPVAVITRVPGCGVHGMALAMSTLYAVASCPQWDAPRLLAWGVTPTKGLVVGASPAVVDVRYLQPSQKPSLAHPSLARSYLKRQTTGCPRGMRWWESTRPPSRAEWCSPRWA
jgi:hypothetical protein